MATKDHTYSPSMDSMDYDFSGTLNSNKKIDLNESNQYFLVPHAHLKSQGMNKMNLS